MIKTYEQLLMQILGQMERVGGIVHIIPTLDIGGTELVLLRLIQHSTLGLFHHQVVCLGQGGGILPRFVEANIPVFCCGIHPQCPNPWKLLQLRRWMADQNPDLIAGWLYHGNFVSLLMAQGLGCRVIWNIRQCVISRQQEKKVTAALRWLGARFSWYPERIVYNSRKASMEHEALGYDPTKTYVIPNTVDATVFAPNSLARIEVRQELQISSDAVLIGLIARYHPIKGHAIFLQAAQLALAQVPQLHFILLGTGTVWSNPELANMIQQLGIPSSNIHLMGEQTHIERYTAALDIANSCSLSEAQSNAILEAVSCGVYCVVSNVGDSAELVGSYGAVVPVGDSNQLAAAWLQHLGLAS